MWTLGKEVRLGRLGAVTDLVTDAVADAVTDVVDPKRSRETVSW